MTVSDVILIPLLVLDFELFTPLASDRPCELVRSPEDGPRLVPSFEWRAFKFASIEIEYSRPRDREKKT